MTRWIPLALLVAAGTLFAGPITYYNVRLSGPAESPPNASPGIGFASITIDTISHILDIVSDDFSGLLGTTTASHIHCCTLPTAGVATQTPSFVGFPLGVTSGSYSHTFDMTLASTWNASFITGNGGTPAGAEAALAAGALAGNAYLNIHTTVVPGGEIRGFLVAVPEPGTLALSLAALAGIFLVTKVRQGRPGVRA
jgi:hypothetical protein